MKIPNIPYTGAGDIPAMRSTLAESIDKARSARGLELIDDETYGHDSRAINKHRVRIYKDGHGKLFMLNRTLDGVPPFFEAYGPYSPVHEGMLPRLKVDGKDYWGDGLSWKKATVKFFAAIATLTK